MGIAWIISDYPITAASLRAILTDRYTLRLATWDDYNAELLSDAALVILDVTHVTADVALACVAALHPDVQIVVASLDRNEIDVYRMSPDGLAREAELPSLLALPSGFHLTAAG